MCGAYALAVPLRVSTWAGRNWADLEAIDVERAAP
jgi:hypothetical protein